MSRKLCETCQRPSTVCICEHLTTLTAPCELVILQHPSEQKQALATVPILQACLSNLTVIVGEELAGHPVVHSILEQPEGTFIIFPTEGADVWDLALPKPSEVNVKRLIILDGTWRKAKLLWHLNPWLNAFKTVTLCGLAKSEYVIRSSTVPGGVSTLEAVMHSCNYLSDSQLYRPLINPFKAMIDWQIKKMGEETFSAHYSKKDN